MPPALDGVVALAAATVILKGIIDGDGDGDDDAAATKTAAVTTILDEESIARVTPRAVASSGCDARAADSTPDDDAVEMADDKESAMVAVDPPKTTSAEAAAILK